MGIGRRSRKKKRQLRGRSHEPNESVITFYDTQKLKEVRGFTPRTSFFTHEQSFLTYKRSCFDSKVGTCFLPNSKKTYRLKYSAQTTVKNNRGFVRFLSAPDNPIPARGGSYGSGRFKFLWSEKITCFCRLSDLSEFSTKKQTIYVYIS